MYNVKVVLPVCSVVASASVFKNLNKRHSPDLCTRVGLHGHVRVKRGGKGGKGGEGGEECASRHRQNRIKNKKNSRRFEQT